MKKGELFDILAEKTGVRLNGDKPWDIQVHNPDMFKRILRSGTLGLGESYMDGWWDCERIDEMVCKAMATPEAEKMINHNVIVTLHNLIMGLFNLQTIRRAVHVAEKHYNYDQVVFEAMLDPYMQYSCGYWERAESLDDAQLAKMDMICKKLALQPGMRVLDIGCGWGGLARYMAEHCGVEVTGINIATEQLAYAKKHAGNLPVTYEEKDYRLLTGTWDRIVSVGMFEHVGRRNYHEFFNVARKCMADDGLFLLHTIGSNGGENSGFDPWLEKYIFPNSILPSPASISNGLEKFFVLEDWHNFGADYDKTAMAWQHNFEDGYRNHAFKCDERARRMFTYYLTSCAGAFRSRKIQLWQLVLSPRGINGGYLRPQI